MINSEVCRRPHALPHFLKYRRKERHAINIVREARENSSLFNESGGIIFPQATPLDWSQRIINQDNKYRQLRKDRRLTWGWRRYGRRRGLEKDGNSSMRRMTFADLIL